MATVIIKLVSTAKIEREVVNRKTGEIKKVLGKTGFFYITKKNSKKTEKIKIKKFDPVVRKHVDFEEGKK